MLEQGTKKKTKFEIAEILGAVGATISFSSDSYRLRFSVRCLKDNIGLVAELIAEQLKEPLLHEEDLNTVKKRMIADLEHQKQSTGRQANIAFSQVVYPRNHPNFELDLEEQIKEVNAITIQDVMKFHSHFGIGSMIIACVGDVSPDEVKAVFSKHFDDWKESPMKCDPIQTKAMVHKEKQKKDVEMKDKTSLDTIIGQSIGINRFHEDFLPLFVGVYILGGNFSARLMSTVRDKEGLTYGIRAAIDGLENGTDGFWIMSGTFSPSLLQKGIDSSLHQIHEWAKNGATEEELKNKKTTIVGNFKVALSTSRGLAVNIITNAERGRLVSYLDEYPKLIQEISLKKVNDAINQYIIPNTFINVTAGTFQK